MSNYSFDTEYDLVIIGGGAAGKMAALTAKRGGLNVVILEKTGAAMGSAQHAEGTCAFESSESKARVNGPYHMPSKKEGFQEYMRFSHYRASAPVVSMFVENSAETIEVLKGIGVEYEDVVRYIPDMQEELATMHLPKGLGLRNQELLLKAVQDEGVDIFVNTPVKKLVIEDNAVIGVEADTEDGPISVGGKAVLIATGGYGCNPEMIKKYNNLGGNTDVWFTVGMLGVENTGDGFVLAEQAGGVINGGGVVQLFASGIGKLVISQSGAAGTQPWLWVNQGGQRFIHEDISTRGTFAGPALASQKGSIGYGILDVDAMQQLVEKGSQIGFGAFLPPHTPMTHLMDELAQDMENGQAWKADTLEELAEKMGVPVDVFVKTVNDYNAYCDAGEDKLFFKDPQYLRPMRKAPFYGIRIAPDYPTTCGGIMINEKLQVLNSDYEPIAGLYAAGNDASGLYGDAYTMTIPGSTNGFAHTSGMVAAKVILDTLKA